MKKTIKSLLAIAVAAFAFTACSDVPQPEGYNNNTGDVVPFEHTGSGTKADPYTSTDAINYAKSLGGKESTNFVFIKGKVSRIETTFTASGSYGNGVFYISDDGTADANKEFYVYRALYLGNQKFASSDIDIKVGDDVVVYGRIVNYNSKTPETVSGTAFLYSLNGVDRGGADDDPGVVIDPQGTGTEADPFNVAAAIKKCEEVGETASTDKYYIKGIANADFTVTNYGNVEVDIIDEGATSKTFKVYRCKGNNNQSIPSGYQVHKGDVIIVYGPVVNFKGNTPETATGAYIVSINGADPAGGSGGGGEVTPGTPSGTGTLADPFNVAAAVKKCQEVGETATTENFYVKGIVEADYTVDSYKNATFNLLDAEGATQKFTAYRVIGPDGKKLKEGYKITKGATVVVCGKLVNFRGNTPETAQNSGFIVTVNGQAPQLDGEESGNGGGGSDTGAVGTTADNPFTVAQAIAKCQETGQTATTDVFYVKGIVEAEYTVDSYKNATFNLIDAEGSSAKFTCYRVKGGNSSSLKNLKEGYVIPKGATVIVGGKFVNYKGNTPETSQNTGFIVTVNGQAPELAE